MGFECQLAAESRGGRAAANEKSCMAMIDRVERGCKKVHGRWREGVSARSEHTDAPASQHLHGPAEGSLGIDHPIVTMETTK
jgi:hypothetical protein